MGSPLFEHLSEIGVRLQAAPLRLLCLGVDGSLLPRGHDPQLPRETHRLLLTLSRLPGLAVAVFSGRERADVQARVAIPQVIYAGNHGLDIGGPGLLFVEPTAASQGEALDVLTRTLAERLLALPGVEVKTRGLTSTVQLQQLLNGDRETARRIIHGVLASCQHPFMLSAGDEVYEIRPRVDWHQGKAVSWIRAQLAPPEAVVIYVGDDETDEDAFATFRDEVTVRVGPVAETAARYQVDDPADVQRFLRWLADELR